MRIHDREIGPGHSAYIIAEMSGNHAGRLDLALRIVDEAARAGADCIKIQTYTPDTLTIDCDEEYFYIKGKSWHGENLYHLYEKATTPWEWHKDIMDEAGKVGIDFFSTPFDNSSVDFLEELGVDFYKIASFELVDIPLLKYVARTGKPMIMSTGMSTIGEIEDAVNAVRSQGNDNIALMRCASAYPAITDEMNLRTMQSMAEVFSVPVGLSDHSAGSIGPVTAVALGGSLIEKHICLGREIETPDSAFSMNPEEFAQMVRDVRQAERAIGRVSYGPTAQEKESLAFRRSLFAVRDIKAGEKLTSDNVRSIRPGYGLPPKYYDMVIGSSALEDIKRGTPLKFGMFA